MPASPDDLFAFLDRNAIVTTTTDHAAVFTVEQSRDLRGTISGAHTKNLFLRDNKRRFFLVTLDEERIIDLKALRPLIGAKGGLSFASTEALMEHLGVTPGSVSPLALLNDTAGAVTMVLDQRLLADDVVNLHPLINSKTTSVRAEDLLRFLRITEHEPLLLDFEAPAIDGAEGR